MIKNIIITVLTLTVIGTTTFAIAEARTNQCKNMEAFARQLHTSIYEFNRCYNRLEGLTGDRAVQGLIYCTKYIRQYND